ncbi:hypothetical protein BJ742DRAFT_802245 [Cladochytrium replicatum]|nr:hypothetical protein BJ742DRAFT_802245 [Cladochytrium replicatum]
MSNSPVSNRRADANGISKITSSVNQVNRFGFLSDKKPLGKPNSSQLQLSQIRRFEPSSEVSEQPGLTTRELIVGTEAVSGLLDSVRHAHPKEHYSDHGSEGEPVSPTHSAISGATLFWHLSDPWWRRGGELERRCECGVIHETIAEVDKDTVAGLSSCTLRDSSVKKGVVVEAGCQTCVEVVDSECQVETCWCIEDGWKQMYDQEVQVEIGAESRSTGCQTFLPDYSDSWTESDAPSTVDSGCQSTPWQTSDASTQSPSLFYLANSECRTQLVTPCESSAQVGCKCTSVESWCQTQPTERQEASTQDGGFLASVHADCQTYAVGMVETSTQDGGMLRSIDFECQTMQAANCDAGTQDGGLIAYVESERQAKDRETRDSSRQDGGFPTYVDTGCQVTNTERLTQDEDLLACVDSECQATYTETRDSSTQDCGLLANVVSECQLTNKETRDSSTQDGGNFLNVESMCQTIAAVTAEVSTQEGGLHLAVESQCQTMLKQFVDCYTQDGGISLSVDLECQTTTTDSHDISTQDGPGVAALLHTECQTIHTESRDSSTQDGGISLAVDVECQSDSLPTREYAVQKGGVHLDVEASCQTNGPETRESSSQVDDVVVDGVDFECQFGVWEKSDFGVQGEELEVLRSHCESCANKVATSTVECQSDETEFVCLTCKQAGVKERLSRKAAPMKSGSGVFEIDKAAALFERLLKVQAEKLTKLEELVEEQESSAKEAIRLPTVSVSNESIERQLEAARRQNELHTTYISLVHEQLSVLKEELAQLRSSGCVKEWEVSCFGLTTPFSEGVESPCDLTPRKQYGQAGLTDVMEVDMNKLKAAIRSTLLKNEKLNNAATKFHDQADENTSLRTAPMGINSNHTLIDGTRIQHNSPLFTVDVSVQVGDGIVDNNTDSDETSTGLAIAAFALGRRNDLWRNSVASIASIAPSHSTAAVSAEEGSIDHGPLIDLVVENKANDTGEPKRRPSTKEKMLRFIRFGENVDGGRSPLFPGRFVRARESKQSLSEQ